MPLSRICAIGIDPLIPCLPSSDFYHWRSCRIRTSFDLWASRGLIFCSQASESAHWFLPTAPTHRLRLTIQVLQPKSINEYNDWKWNFTIEISDSLFVWSPCLLTNHTPLRPSSNPKWISSWPRKMEEKTSSYSAGRQTSSYSTRIVISIKSLFDYFIFLAIQTVIHDITILFKFLDSIVFIFVKRDVNVRAHKLVNRFLSDPEFRVNSPLQFDVIRNYLPELMAYKWIYL